MELRPTEPRWATDAPPCFQLRTGGDRTDSYILDMTLNPCSQPSQPSHHGFLLGYGSAVQPREAY